MSEPEVTPAAPQEQQQEQLQQQEQPQKQEQQQPQQEPATQSQQEQPQQQQQQQQPASQQQDVAAAAAVPAASTTTATTTTTTQDSAELESLKKSNQQLQDKIQELTKQLAEAQAKATSAAAAAPPPAAAAPPPPPPPPSAPPPPPAPAPPPPPPGAGPPPPPPPPGGGPPPPPPPPGGKGGPPGPPPPPGGKGGPPPPPGGKGGPPPPGGAKGKKPPLKPKNKLKNFNWVIVPPIKLPATLWEKANDDAILKTLNFDEIETMFGMASTVASSTPTAGATKGSKPQVVSLLDMKRSNNISIAMSRFGKVSPADIKKGILELNEQLLTIENLNTLVNFVPTQEEIDLLNEYDGDKNQLGVPEKFFLEISTIPLLEQRLKAMVAKRLFTTKITAILDSLKAINTAVHEVTNCKKLIGVFEIILGIGNYLNGGTTRGQAYGFKLDALGKLTDLRANTGGTLINYVAKISDSKGLANFPDELKTVNDASKESLQGAITDLSKLKGELNLIKTEGSNTGHNSPGDKFRSVMTAFVDQATKDFEQAEKLANETEAAHTTMCKFFVEDPKSDSLQFFETIQKFLSAWDKAQKENKKPGKK